MAQTSASTRSALLIVDLTDDARLEAASAMLVGRAWLVRSHNVLIAAVGMANVYLVVLIRLQAAHARTAGLVMTAPFQLPLLKSQHFALTIAQAMGNV